ncbi:sulfatase [Caldivirga sp.]|uniref:sulfatase n=1 Tax=Caldivirga sp. TaxID=2080243 RepID=UPI0025BDBBE1|nr:sulfatase [Caldivirga sp.]
MLKPLNFIIIVSDTFRLDLITGFRVRGRVVRVPFISHLASGGVFFTRAYTASFPTVPNRHDLLTGKFTFTYHDWAPLPPGEVTLPVMLRGAGYVSVLIADTPHILKDGFNYDRGFDAWVWVRGQENDRFRIVKDVKLPCSPSKLRDVETTLRHIVNNAGRIHEEDWIPAKTIIEASHWLEENYNLGKPFLLHVDLFDPHEPWDPPRWLIDRLDPGYSGEEVIYPAYGPSDYLTIDEVEHVRALYAAEALLVDKWVSRLLEKVDELGLLDNTVIVFTSDHGFYLGEHGLIGKSVIMGEHHGYAPLYEEVAHIPLIVRFPDSMGIRSIEFNGLVQPPDITATILNLAGVDYVKYGVQGKPLLPYITGEVKEPIRGIAVTSPPIIHGTAGGLRPTVTADEWSLIMAFEDSQGLEGVTYTMIVDGKPRVLKPFGRIETELYNLVKDPKQGVNIASGNWQIIEELHGKFIKLLRELGTREEHLKPLLKLKKPSTKN